MLKQPALFDRVNPELEPGYVSPPPIDGATYEPERDGERLGRQLVRVFDLMKDRRWRTLAEIAETVQGSEAAVSARLRDFRKAKCGSHTVERRYLYDGIFEYQLTTNGPLLHG